MRAQEIIGTLPAITGSQMPRVEEAKMIKTAAMRRFWASSGFRHPSSPPAEHASAAGAGAGAAWAVTGAAALVRLAICRKHTMMLSERVWRNSARLQTTLGRAIYRVPSPSTVLPTSLYFRAPLHNRTSRMASLQADHESKHESRRPPPSKRLSVLHASTTHSWSIRWEQCLPQTCVTLC